MHELSYVKELFDLVKKRNKKRNRVVSVNISVSVLSGIDADSVNFYWKELSRNTQYSATVLHISTLPTSIICERCKKSSVINENAQDLLQCPFCFSTSVLVNDTFDIRVNNIEVESDYE